MGRNKMDGMKKKVFARKWENFERKKTPKQQQQQQHANPVNGVCDMPYAASANI